MEKTITMSLKEYEQIKKDAELIKKFEADKKQSIITTYTHTYFTEDNRVDVVLHTKEETIKTLIDILNKREDEISKIRMAERAERIKKETHSMFKRW